MKEHTREEPKILAAAERKMKDAALAEEIADRAARVDRGEETAHPLGHFITISREAGAGAEEIAQRVGADLGWEVLDKNLLEQVAERYGMSRQMLELVDETETNWAYDSLWTWLDPKVIPHEKYFVHLSRVIVAAAKRGGVVLVGRGARFLLPRKEGLAVRIVASEKLRVEALAKRHGITATEARRMMADLDHGRREFVEHFFHHHVDDPHYYDLVINVDRLGPAGAARQIVVAHQNHAETR